MAVGRAALRGIVAAIFAVIAPVGIAMLGGLGDWWGMMVIVGCFQLFGACFIKALAA